MKNSEMLELTVQTASSAAAISTGLALVLWRRGLMPDDTAAAFSKRMRELAEQMEKCGLDGPASELWTAANLLEKPAPKGRG